MSNYAFGADIGGTTVKIVMFDKEGNKQDAWEIPTRTENNGSNILPDIAASIKEKMKDNDLDNDDVIGIGITAPGPVQEDGTILVAVNLGWGTFNIPNTMENLMGGGIKVKAGNDANLAALGEQWKGGGRGCKDMVMVTLGTGVGGGVIIGGKVIAGVTGSAGEIGHMHIEDDETDVCNCGNCGCFEQYASATGVVRIAKRILAKTKKDSSLRKLETLTSKDIFDEAKNGDEVAIEITEKYGYYLGKGLALIATVINPEMIVLGGGVSKAGEGIIRLLKPSFEKYVFKGARETKFALATLGNDAGMYGAAKLVL
ncbi:MAG: ROK family glucokinase [Lachnospiraceae bacterium]|nr:ROK family glucokinase [Lachnospiraceae bacterium]